MTPEERKIAIARVVDTLPPLTAEQITRLRGIIDGSTVIGERTLVYRYYGENDQLLYVGITNDEARREAQHELKSKWWPYVLYKKTDWKFSRSEAATAEILAIKTENPVYNIQRPDTDNWGKSWGEVDK